MRALQVAGVGQLPGQADRRVQAELELLVERAARLRPPPDEAQAARVEVVGQRAEALRRAAPCRRRDGRPGGDARRPWRLVHAAHAVDRDVLDQQLLLDQGLLLHLGGDLVLDDRIPAPAWRSPSGIVRRDHPTDAARKSHSDQNHATVDLVTMTKTRMDHGRDQDLPPVPPPPRRADEPRARLQGRQAAPRGPRPGVLVPRHQHRGRRGADRRPRAAVPVPRAQRGLPGADRPGRHHLPRRRPAARRAPDRLRDRPAHRALDADAARAARRAC